MAKSIIQQIKFCANKLKNSKLARLGGKEISEALDNLTACLGLENREEAIVSFRFRKDAAEGHATLTKCPRCTTVPTWT